MARLKERIVSFGRSVTYRIAGLPIAVRAIVNGRSDAPEAVIRRAYARRYWRPLGVEEQAQLALAIVGWPLALLGLAATYTARNGASVARSAKRGIAMQFLDQLRLYLTAGVLPPWYYIFELYLQPQTRHARDFIYRWESKGGVLQQLREARSPASELNDKAEFARFCQRHQIRTAPVLAVVRDGETKLNVSAAELQTDLFVKPVCGRGGKGAERWDYRAGRYRGTDGQELSCEDLFERLERRSRKVPLIVQQRLRNHPDLKPLNNDALSTVRILTCLNEAGEPELVGAAARMAIGANHMVDNLHAGGIAASVDLDSGVIGPASTLGASGARGWLDHHPDSGARIAGARLPVWGETKRFAQRVHKVFTDRVVVGWDVAITPDGPVLVEGNGSPDLDIMQRFVRHGLMAARLGVLLAFHLSQLDIDQLPL